MTLDLKITDARIVDGTGRSTYSGDVGVRDGLIVEIGQITARARRVINAQGALLTPGFIDPHTHYDGQAFWDDELQTSARHGVTTAVFGNCGVGFAPLTPGRHEDLITLMSGVEDVPGSVLAVGLDWNWESFVDYLGRLSEREWTIDIAAQITHDPLRMYVMGERALRREPATDEDIERMRRLVSEALGAGAFGFSTGRHDAHRMADGRDTPASLASQRELVGIAEAFRGHGHRVLQVVSDYNLYNTGPEAFEEEFDLIEKMARTAQRPLSLTLTQRPDDQGQWRTVMQRVEEGAKKGLRMAVQVSPRAVGVLMGLTSSFHPFIAHPSFQPIAKLSVEKQVEALRSPFLKQKILSEKPVPYAGKDNAASQFFENLLQNLESFSARIFPDRGDRNFEPSYEESLHAEARRRGVPPIEAVYDALLERDGRALLYWPVLSYEPGNLDYVREMLLHPNAIMALGDAGAHVNNINDYTYSTFAISFWPTRRVAGPGLPLEYIVRLMTASPAAHLGLADRGLIEVGRRADLNLIDQDRLALEPIRVARDLPGGEKRLLQGARGYLATFKNGVAILENDELTDARPGRLLRAA